MRHMSMLLSLVLVALSCTAPARAGAPRPHISYQHRREARRLFNQGHLAYRRGNYEEAILKWQESYDLSKEPLIFESIANAYERLGDPKRALEHLRKWRAKAPRREHAALDSRIENLEQRVARAEEQAQQERQAEERRRKRAQAARRREEQKRRREEQLRAEQQQGPSVATISGWTMVATGAAAVVAGVVLDVVATVTRPAEQEACAERNGKLLCRDALREDIQVGNQLAVAGDITWIAGAAIAAGGVGVLWLTGSDADGGADDAHRSGMHLCPALGSKVGALMLVGRF